MSENLEDIENVPFEPAEAEEDLRECLKTFFELCEVTILERRVSKEIAQKDLADLLALGTKKWVQVDTVTDNCMVFIGKYMDESEGEDMPDDLPEDWTDFGYAFAPSRANRNMEEIFAKFRRGWSFGEVFNFKPDYVGMQKNDFVMKALTSKKGTEPKTVDVYEYILMILAPT
ncbi:MAG: hypothetical protein H7326_11035 [Bdellovibrionaceae bacterium]|nr:hypothetical protein [Pseudobdellovibrionaceae bacterium]